MWIELDGDVWPKRKALIGLRFRSPADWQRALALLPEDTWDFYREVYPAWRMLVVRKSDAQRWRDTCLVAEEVEQLDDDDLTPAEIAERDQEAIDYWKPLLLERLQRRP